MSEQMTHILIARACAADPEGQHIQMRGQYTKEPPGADLGNYRETVVRAYKKFFGAEPARVGVAVLPFIVDEDDPDEATVVGEVEDDDMWEVD